MQSCLVVFTKPATPGRVKTRLAGDLSPEEAADLHAALLADLLDEVRAAGVDCWLAWALEDGERLPPSSLPAIRQEGAALGERLYLALTRAAASHARVAAVGSDHPGLASGSLQHAFAALGEADLAIVPALDGGYALIAARAAALDPALFSNIPWSTSEVLAETLARAARLGRRVAILEAAADLDTPADLERLCERLAAGAPAAGPRVRRLLGNWGRIPDSVAP